jgi:hypothetical protein
VRGLRAFASGKDVALEPPRILNYVTPNADAYRDDVAACALCRRLVLKTDGAFRFGGRNPADPVGRRFYCTRCLRRGRARLFVLLALAGVGLTVMAVILFAPLG